MEDHLFKLYFTLPFKVYKPFDSKVFDDNNNSMFDFLSDWMSGIIIQKIHCTSSEDRNAIIQILNGKKQSKLHEQGYSVSHKDGVVLLNIKDIQYGIMLIRGWGHLTGNNGLKLSPEIATEIQISLADYICEKLNQKPQ